MAYVGSTIDATSRFKNHRSNLIHGRHHNQPLQKAFDKNNKLTVVFIPTAEQVDVVACEQVVLDELASEAVLYNTAVNARSGSAGREHSPESIEKMRTAKLGKTLSAEHVEKIRMGNLGKKHSQESIEKMRESAMSRDMSRTLTPEGRARLSQAATGRVLSEETRDKLSKLRLGVPKSEEHKQKMIPVLLANAEKKWIAVSIDGNEYPSILAAAAATGIPKSTIAARVSKHGRTL